MNLKRCFTADFETTTDEDDCRVWAYSICNIDDYTDFRYGNNIDDFFKFCMNTRENYKIWFHNLKFDIVFLLNFLLTHGYTFISNKKERSSKTFTTLITDTGQVYSLTVWFSVTKSHVNKVEFYDSLKVFPNFSVERIAEGFNLPIKKLKIDYKAYRPVGHQLTIEEVAYIRNDVEIVARALKEMFGRGLTKMTIASDAMNYFREHFDKFRARFPLLPPEIDKDIRKSYKGGFTYLNDVWQGKESGKGITLDVNSLYPSCMCSPYFLPYGRGLYFEGEYKPDTVYPLYVQGILTAFKLKEGKIPSIQIKKSFTFADNEYIKTTNNERVELYLTKPDLELFKEQYDITYIKYICGWKFKAASGFFDEYVNYWTEQKIKAGKEGNKPQRAIAKLMLNSLYGRFALNSKSQQKVPYLDEGVVCFSLLPEETRETIYIPVAAFITAYGRCKTIRSSQAIKDFSIKKYGVDKYLYSDTDSIKTCLTEDDLEELKDIIEIDDYKLGAWALEEHFDRFLGLRQKCYITESEGKTNVTVAGLPKYLAPLINFDNFKKGFTTAGMNLDDMVKLAQQNGATEEEIEALHHKLTYKYVNGGVILADTDFTIK